MTSAHASGSEPIPGTYPGGRVGPTEYGDTSSLALGTSAFAGVMLIMVSVFQILQGIAATAAGTVYVTGAEYVFQLDVTTWGWIHIVVGAIALATGIGVLAGQTWAYVAGIVLAAVSALANFAFIPYYPFWTLLIIAFDVAVIWALSTLVAHHD
ncbi:DUF7144 family membrane protein [Promicromonospora sukumoe]|jgi:hypothetical protein